MERRKYHRLVKRGLLRSCSAGPHPRRRGIPGPCRRAASRAAIDRTGKVFILQARPLTGQAGSEHAAPVKSEGLAPSREHPIIVQNSGTVVQRGAGSGPVHIVRNPSDLESFPKGAVLVAPSDSSLFVRVIPAAAAIITERGSLTSHMAALARELRVPTIVGLPGAVESMQKRGHNTVLA